VFSTAGPKNYLRNLAQAPKPTGNVALSDADQASTAPSTRSGADRN